MKERRSDLRSCEATEAVAKKAQKTNPRLQWVWAHDLRDTGAMLYQLSYEVGSRSGAGSVYTRYMRGVR